VRRAVGIIAVLASVWTLAVWLSDGVVLSLGSLRISSADAARPLIVALAATAAYLALSRPSGVREDARSISRAMTPLRLAAALTIVVLTVGLTNNSWGAGASDSYSYVSQMDLWRTGTLKVPITMAAEVPWPNALATFTPFGYAAVAHEMAIAPITGPGLPLLMALCKTVGGQTAAFMVVPLTGALLVWTTFLLGRRVGSDLIGACAAWLVATSPTFLMMFKSQMSDVPAAAFCALAVYWALGTTTRSAVAAGMAAALAILVRPNLLSVALVIAVWLFVKDRRRSIPFLATIAPACVAMAALYDALFGSPFASGYGDIGSLFSIKNIPKTLGSYPRWLIETQTPVVFAGLFIFRIAPLLGWVVLAVWGVYAAYLAFDAWWFLRFLLPTWPPMFIGTAAALVWLLDRRRWGHAASAALVVALGIYGIVVTAQRHVFTRDEGERRYATIAELVAAHTEPSAMILASIHAGSLRYYAGRATLRFDILEPDWLDRATRWLNEHGRHPYVLVEDWEMPAFRNRFGPANALGELRLAPVLAYKAYGIPGRVYLFDLLRPDGPTFEPPSIRDPQPRCPPPAQPPLF